MHMHVNMCVYTYKCKTDMLNQIMMYLEFPNLPRPGLLGEKWGRRKCFGKCIMFCTEKLLQWCLL